MRVMRDASASDAAKERCPAMRDADERDASDKSATRDAMFMRRYE
jgi:hypothetical protein